MDHIFTSDTFVCINIAGKPTVQEITAGTHLATIHPWTQHDTLDAAIAAAQGIDPAYEHDSGPITARGQ